MLEGILSRTRNAQRRAKYEAALRCPALPASLGYLWRIFHRLRRRKGSNGFGTAPLEWSDIDAFIRLTGLRLSPWEVETIEELDDLFLVDYAKLQMDLDDG